MDEIAGMMLLAAALTVGGFVLFFRRWRRADPAWHCAACDYNLTGLTSDDCPECGRDLRPPRSRTRGTRRPPAGARWAAAALLMIALLVWGQVLLQAYQKTKLEWYRYRPTFLVLRNLGGSNLELRDRACAELCRRQVQGQLSLSQRQTALARMLPLLHAQGNVGRKTNIYLNSFCTQALANGLMTPQQIQDFLPWVDSVRFRWDNYALRLDGETVLSDYSVGRTFVTLRQVDWVELDGQRVTAPVRDLLVSIPEHSHLSWGRYLSENWSGPAHARSLTASLRTTWYEVPAGAVGDYVKGIENDPPLFKQLLAEGRARPIAAYCYTATLEPSTGWRCDLIAPPTWLPLSLATQPAAQSAGKQSAGKQSAGTQQLP